MSLSFPSSLENIVVAYMGSLSTEPVRSVSDLCGRIPVSRTTFYKHFESLYDLDQRFLYFYFRRYMGSTAQTQANYQELIHFYRSLVQAMRDQPEFFERVILAKVLPRYLFQWLQLVDERVRVLFTRPGKLSHPGLWKLHLDLGLGVIHRYMELGLACAPEELDDLTQWTMEYLWGGLSRFSELADGQGANMPEELTKLLQRRALEETRKYALRPSLLKPPKP